MDVLDQAIQDATSTLDSLPALRESVEKAAQLIKQALLGGHKLLVCGNGGSAADGADFSTEFTCRFREDRRPFPALNLAAGESLLTAIGNDYGFDEIFARQVEAYAKPGDILVAITTSGNSANICRALEQARAMGVKSIALLGRGGGKAKGLATLELLVQSEITARVQEAHKFLLHVICEMIDPELRKG